MDKTNFKKIDIDKLSQVQKEQIAADVLGIHPRYLKSSYNKIIVDVVKLQNDLDVIFIRFDKETAPFDPVLI